MHGSYPISILSQVLVTVLMLLAACLASSGLVCRLTNSLPFHNSNDSRPMTVTRQIVKLPHWLAMAYLSTLPSFVRRLHQFTDDLRYSARSWPDSRHSDRPALHSSAA